MGGLVLAAVLAGAAFRDVAPALPSWLGPFVVLLSAGVSGGLRPFLAATARAPAPVRQLQQAQEEAMRRAVEEERSRIAAELHDVVTHNVSVMVIQAGAARKVMDTAPEQSKQALLAVEAGGRAAMAELRHVMGLLAGPDGDAGATGADGLEPQPGLDQLDALVERVRAAGMPVSVDGVATARPAAARGRPGRLPRRPGGPDQHDQARGRAPTASVTIESRGDWLEIEVTDTGAARTARRALTGDGRGLIGLRERLAVYGGTLDAGPRPGGGYQIKARCPVDTT